MVVTRRKQPRTRGASPSVERSRRSHNEGLSFPCVLRPPLARHHWGAAVLSLRHIPYRLALSGVALAKRVADAQSMSIGPRGLHDDASQMGVAPPWGSRHA